MGEPVSWTVGEVHQKALHGRDWGSFERITYPRQRGMHDMPDLVTIAHISEGKDDSGNFSGGSVYQPSKFFPSSQLYSCLRLMIL